MEGSCYCRYRANVHGVVYTYVNRRPVSVLWDLCCSMFRALVSVGLGRVFIGCVVCTRIGALYV